MWEVYLEVEDSSIHVCEALTVRNHTMQQPLIQCQRANGSQQPAVTWRNHNLLLMFMLKGVV